MRPEPPLVFHPSSLADLPLDLVIDRLDGGLGDEDGFLITLRDVRRGLQIGFRPARASTPSTCCWAGTRLREVDALGVAVSGTARSLDAGPGPDAAAGRVRIVQLHARDGRAASRIRRVGADPPNVLDTGAGRGRRGRLPAAGARAAHPAPSVRSGRVVGGRLARRGARGGLPRARPGPGPGPACPGCTRCSGPLPPDSPEALVELVAREGAGLDWSSDPAPRAAPTAGRAARSVPSWRPGWTTGCSPGGSSAPGPTRSTWWSISSTCCRRRSPEGVVEALQAWGCW